jgi:hypothetical protein
MTSTKSIRWKPGTKWASTSAFTVGRVGSVLEAVGEGLQNPALEDGSRVRTGPIKLSREQDSCRFPCKLRRPWR